MEKDNRKSHLTAQLSPASQDLLRTSDSSPRQTASDERFLHSPSSGEIPIGGAGIISPLEQSHNLSPSTANGTASARAVTTTTHPGLGPRGATTNSVPQATSRLDAATTTAATTTKTTTAAAKAVSAGNATFNLPVRPAHASASLPPLPGRMHPPTDEGRRENRRQAAYGLPPNPAYGL